MAIDVLIIRRHDPLHQSRLAGFRKRGMRNSRRGGRVKDDIHGLGNADAVNVLDQAQGNKRCTAAVINQERETSAVEHPCPIKHVWQFAVR